MKEKKAFHKIFLALLCTLSLTACTKTDAGSKPKDESQNSQISSAIGSPTDGSDNSDTSGDAQGSADSFPENTDPEPSYSVHLVCAGDNLIHSNIYKQAHNRAGGNGYDFSYVYERVIKYIEPADIAILNQETIVTDLYEPSNWPNFCTPQALGDYMVDTVGFDVISMSNNHVLDKGEKGLIATLDYWDNEHSDIVRYGAYRNTEDMNNIRTAEVNGITFAFLGYMEHTNGIVNPGTLGTRLVYLNELETIEKQIKQADQIADVVVVSPHFGVEVSNIVTDSQRNLAKKFVEWGADIIIGTQPHTIQECDWIEREDGTRGFVYYCLGNLVSSMDNYLAMVGGIGDIHIEMDPNTRKITLSDPKMIPIITHYGANSSNVTIFPYSEYGSELAAAHGCGLSMSLIKNILDNVPAEYLSVE